MKKEDQGPGKPAASQRGKAGLVVVKTKADLLVLKDQVHEGPDAVPEQHHAGLHHTGEDSVSNPCEDLVSRAGVEDGVRVDVLPLLVHHDPNGHGQGRLDPAKE